MNDKELTKAEIVNNIKELISLGKLIEGINYACSKFADIDEELFNVALLQRSRVFRIERDNNLGLIKQEDYYMNLNKISKGFLDVLDELLKSDFILENEFYNQFKWWNDRKKLRPDIVPGLGIAILGSENFEKEAQELIHCFLSPNFYSWVSTSFIYNEKSSKLIKIEEGVGICDIAIVFKALNQKISAELTLKHIYESLIKRKGVHKDSVELILVVDSSDTYKDEQCLMFDKIIYYTKGEDIRLCILNALDKMIISSKVEDMNDLNESLVLKVVFDITQEEFEINIPLRMEIETAAIKILGDFFFKELPLHKRNAILQHGSFWLLNKENEPISGKTLLDSNLKSGDTVKILSRHTYPWIHDATYASLLTQSHINNWRRSLEYRINRNYSGYPGWFGIHRGVSNSIINNFLLVRIKNSRIFWDEYSRTKKTGRYYFANA